MVAPIREERPGVGSEYQTEQANVCGCCSADFGMVRFLFSFNTIWYGIPLYNTVFLTEGCRRGIVDFTKKKIHLHTYICSHDSNINIVEVLMWYLFRKLISSAHLQCSAYYLLTHARHTTCIQKFRCLL